MISMPLDEIKMRAENWARELGAGSVLAGESTVGGGSLPGESMPSYVLSLTVKSPDQFQKRLREENPAIIARTENDKVLFDPRTVLAGQDEILLSSLKIALRVQQ
jgi:L-seryl-tRNA(Ser) seleniumtransferase